MKTIKVSWTQYHKLVDNLAEQIRKLGKKYKAVYSPDNPMLAFLLSKELGIGHIRNYAFYESETEISASVNGNAMCFDLCDVLIVSDIINIGKTREQYKDFDFACLYYCYFDCNDIFKSPVTFGICEIDKSTKVIMPWEKEIK